MEILNFEIRFRTSGCRCPECGLEFLDVSGRINPPGKYHEDSSRISVSWPGNNQCDRCGAEVVNEQELINKLQEKIKVLHDSKLEVTKG